MGSRRSWGSALLLAALATRAFAQQPQSQVQPPPPTASDAKQGLDLYGEGKFADAIPFLERAHLSDPNNVEIQLALAQALRQTDQCDKALPHYKQIVNNDEARAGQAQCEAKLAPPPPPPAPVTKTVLVHDSISGKDVFMLGAGGAAIGAAAILFFSAHNDANDADAATLISDHDDISARSRNEYIAAGVLGAAGVVLAITAIVSINHSKTESTGIAIAPHANGGSIVLEGSW